MMNKKLSLKKEATLLTISKMINLLITLVTSMLLSRFRSLEEYGTYSQLSLVLNLLTTVCLLGLPSAINYFLPRTETDEEKKSFLHSFFFMNTILSVLAGVLMVVGIPLMASYFKNQGIYGFYYFAALMPWAKMAIQQRSNLLVAAGKTKRLIVYTLLESLSLLVIILLTVVLKRDFGFYMLSFVLVEVVFALLVYFEGIAISGTIKPKLDFKLMGSIMVFALPLGLSDVVNVVTKEVDKLMIGGFLDTESLAIYTNAAREISLTVISTSFIAVMMPKISRMIKENRKEDAIETWKRTTSFTYIFMCFGVASLVVFAPWVISILYSERYLPGVNVFRIYALILLWRTAFFGTMLSLTGETTKILFCSLLTMVLNVFGNIGLYHLLGFTGPAWSTFISIGFVNILQLILTSVVLKYPFAKLFPWLDILKISAINLIMGAGVYFLLKWINPGTDLLGCIIAVGIGIVWIGIYLGIIMRRRIIRQWKEE